MFIRQSPVNVDGNNIQQIPSPRFYFSGARAFRFLSDFPSMVQGSVLAAFVAGVAFDIIAETGTVSAAGIVSALYITPAPDNTADGCNSAASVVSAAITGPFERALVENPNTNAVVISAFIYTPISNLTPVDGAVSTGSVKSASV